MQSRETLP